MQNKEVDVIKFGDWVKKELGEDIVRELKTNSYINYGPMKYIFEYFFVNLYHPKFVKLVKMNLDLKEANALDCDEKVAELKLKNKNLRAKIAKMKSMCEETELEMERQYDAYCNDLQTIHANESYLKSRITDNLVQSTFLTKARQYANKFRIAAKRLSLISDGKDAQTVGNTTASDSLLMESRFGRPFDDGEERAERSMKSGLDETSRKLKVYEMLLLNFQQNRNNLRNDMSRLQQLDLIECLNMLTRKLDTDQSQIKINDLKSIVNDIILVLYKIDPDFNQIKSLLNELRQNDQEVNCLQLISKCSPSKEKEYAQFLELSCRIQYYLMAKEKVASKIGYYGHSLQDFLLHSYSKPDALMYGRFLKTHNAMRTSEKNFSELKKYLDELEQDMMFYKNKFMSVKEKQNKYKELHEMIGQRQVEVVNLINENKRLCSIHNYDNTAKHLLRNNFDKVLDLMHAIKTTNLKPSNQSILSSLTMNESRNNLTMSRGNEICLNKDYENYRSNILASKSAWSSDASKRSQAFLKNKTSLSDGVFKHRSFKSSSFIVDQLYQMFVQMQRELGKTLDNKFIPGSLELINDNQSVSHLFTQMKKLLDKCTEIDKIELKKYSTEMEETANKCKFMKDNIEMLEKLVETWSKQPGAYECHVNLNVNGRNLRHYYNMVEEKLADLAARNKMM